PGETTKVVSVQLFDCAFVQGFQSFTLGLDTPVNASIARASARVGIVNNDTAATTPYRLFVRDAVVDEKDGSVRVAVLLGGPAGLAATSTVIVDYATSDGTASAGTDYTTASGTLSFAPGQTVKTVIVPIADRAGAAPSRSFRLSLSNPSDNATIADGTGTVVIGATKATPVAHP